MVGAYGCGLGGGRQALGGCAQESCLSTADRAWFARKHVAGLKVFGGIVLNSSVGSINSDAVNWMWRMQGGFGRVVWFPTFDATTTSSISRMPPRASKYWAQTARYSPRYAMCSRYAPNRNLSCTLGTYRPPRRSLSSRPVAILASTGWSSPTPSSRDHVIPSHAEFALRAPSHCPWPRVSADALERPVRRSHSI